MWLARRSATVETAQAAVAGAVARRQILAALGLTTKRRERRGVRGVDETPARGDGIGMERRCIVVTGVRKA